MIRNITKNSWMMFKAREIQRKSRWGRRSDRTIVNLVNANIIAGGSSVHNLFL